MAASCWSACISSSDIVKTYGESHYYIDVICVETAIKRCWSCRIRCWHIVAHWQLAGELTRWIEPCSCAGAKLCVKIPGVAALYNVCTAVTSWHETTRPGMSPCGMTDIASVRGVHSIQPLASLARKSLDALHNLRRSNDGEPESSKCVPSCWVHGAVRLRKYVMLCTVSYISTLPYECFVRGYSYWLQLFTFKCDNCLHGFTCTSAQQIACSCRRVSKFEVFELVGQ